MLQQATPRLILASASASRRALLANARVRFDVEPAAIDEAAVKQTARAEGLTAADAAIILADLKAARISTRNPDALVIGADQILVCDGAWFDKPADAAEAETHLRTLRGRTHTLATAAVCHLDGRSIWQHETQPRLTMREFSDAFLAAYLAVEGGALTTTVGAYRLEGAGIHLFSRIEGAHDAILGLPVLPLLQFFRDRGVLTA
ncbi:MAG TPA: Maf family protein [Acetobacteraceae bacterium]|jgi:septum formation protein|nr:Maf family protein [Acetobacteraceae bacterium]